jgi:hypothetical protein
VQGRIIKNKESKIPIIGKIKIGQKNEKGYPESLDYFIASGNYKNYFDEAFGQKPTNIEIMFMSDDFSQSCYERFELRQGAKLFAWGDGQDFKVYDETAEDYLDYNMDEHKDLIKGLNAKVKSDWNTVLCMTFLIPAIHGVFGAWTLTTKGKKSSIPQILGSYDMVQKAAGSVIGIPFDLQVKKVVSNKPESKSKFPVIQLVANVSQGHLEKVRNFIDNKKDFVGFLTEQKIDDLVTNKISKQIEYDTKEQA